MAVVEVYKEPRNLMAAIQTGQLLVWATTLAGGVVIYLGLFSIIRRGSRLLKQQERQLVDAQSQMFAGEMATALAHSLRLEVTAEGVETEAQESFLREHACDETQGFYFSKPVDVEQFAQLVRGHSGAKG